MPVSAVERARRMVRRTKNPGWKSARVEGSLMWVRDRRLAGYTSSDPEPGGGRSIGNGAAESASVRVADHRHELSSFLVVM